MEMNSRVARNYAQALHDSLILQCSPVSQSHSVSPESQLIGAEALLKYLASAYQGSEVLVSSLLNPAYSQAQRTEVLHALAERGSQSSWDQTGGSGETLVLVQRLLSVVAENGRIDLLPSIASSFSQILREREHRVEILVTSASPLDSEAQTRITSALAEQQARARPGSSVAISWHVDPQLVGGLVLRCGDKLIDCSIDGMLTSLRSAISLTASN